MKLSCVECGYEEDPDKLKSFGGKFCPKCGERLVEALSEEKEEAKKSLISIAKVLEAVQEFVEEPFSKRWGLKVTILVVLLLVLQGIGYAGYQVIRPLIVKPEIEQVDPAIQALFDQALDAQSASNFTKAAGLYNKILIAEPENVRALNSLGFNATLAGNSVEAKGYYNQVLKLDPTNTVANQNLGVIAKKAGKTDTALRHFDQVLAVDYENTTAMYLKAEILFKEKNDVTAATELLKNILQISPSHKQAKELLNQINR